MEKERFRMPVGPKAPCYKCEDRFAGCHSRCIRYADWKAEVAKAQKYLDDHQCHRKTEHIFYRVNPEDIVYK